MTLVECPITDFLKVGDCMQATHLKKRLQALFFDYLLILIYLLILFLFFISFYLLVLDGFPNLSESQSHWLSFWTTVFPVTLFFTFQEMRLPFQSFGKKKMGLKVNYKKTNVLGSLLRNIIKFLPWQLGHFAVIKGIYTENFLLPAVIIPYVLAIILPILYILMVAIRKDHRHLPDLIGQSQVVKK